MNHDLRNIRILSIQLLVFCILITNVCAQECNKYDEKTGLDKDGYANPDKPIPTATTNFKLKQGTYKTEDGVTLTVSGNTEVKRNKDGSFDIGGNKVAGTNIQYVNSQYNILGKGSINSVPVNNVNKVHFLPFRYASGDTEPKGIMVGETGDEISSVGGTIFKPKGTIFMHIWTLKTGDDVTEYKLTFQNDAIITGFDNQKRAEIEVKNAKVTLPNGQILDGGTIIFISNQAYVGRDTQINGVIINQGGIGGNDP